MAELVGVDRRRRQQVSRRRAKLGFSPEAAQFELDQPACSSGQGGTMRRPGSFRNNLERRACACPKSEGGARDDYRIRRRRRERILGQEFSVIFSDDGLYGILFDRCGPVACRLYRTREKTLEALRDGVKFGSVWHYNVGNNLCLTFHIHSATFFV